MKNRIVISLANEHQRRQHIDTLFEEYELDFDYFDAINKQQAADILAKYNLSVTNELLSAGEVACYFESLLFVATSCRATATLSHGI
jgi:glycosyl transferase family 25